MIYEFRNCSNSVVFSLHHTQLQFVVNFSCGFSIFEITSLSKIDASLKISGAIMNVANSISFARILTVIVPSGGFACVFSSILNLIF